jgi:hypothetical protein
MEVKMDYHRSLDVNLPSLLYAAQKTIIALTELPNNVSEGKEGGFLTIRDKDTGHILITLLIGRVPHEKAVKYHELSQEKGGRLHNRICLGENHISSWQSRNPDNGLWGGAIATEKFVVSFSGMPELGDEAIVLLIAMQMKWLNQQEAEVIASTSQNSFFIMLDSRLSH